MKTAALICLALAAWWTFMILMVLLTAYYRRWRQRRWFRPITHISGAAPRCLLLRPCAGEDAGLMRCLTSVTGAIRHFPIEVLIGVERDDDPAVPIAAAAAKSLAAQGIDCRLLVMPPSGLNRKVSILAGLTAAARTDYDIVISADSNTDLTGFDLDRFVATISSTRDVAAVWAPPHLYTHAGGLGNLAAKAVLHGSWHSFGLLGAIDPGGIVGKLFAVTRDALAELGGFEAIADYLGEDMALSKRLRDAGYTVMRFPRSVRTVLGKSTWTDTLDRYARWMLVIKAQRRRLMISYPLLFFNSLIIYALALFGIVHSPSAGVACLAAAFGLRLFVAHSAARFLEVRLGITRAVCYAVIADVVLVVAFLRALKMKSVIWRGTELFFESNGKLRSAP